MDIPFATTRTAFTFNCVAHGYAHNTPVRVSSSGTLPAPLEAARTYYVANPAADTFQLALVPDGEPFAVNDAGTGTLTVIRYLPDADPSAILTEFLTGVDGAGFPAAQLADLTQYHNYCIASGTLLSPALIEQQEAHLFVERLLNETFSAPVFSENKLKIVPCYDSALTGNGITFTPSVAPIYNLTDDDFQPMSGDDPVQVERLDPADAYNQVTVKFFNRYNQYNEESIELKDQAAIERYGLRPAPPVTFEDINEPAVAKWAGALVLSQLQNIRNRYKFRLSAQYLLLEPMDVVTLTETETDNGLSNVPVRIREQSEDEDGFLDFVAEDFPVGAASAVLYPRQAVGGYLPNYNAEPGIAATPVMFIAPYALTKAWLQLVMGISGGPDFGGCEIWVSDDGGVEYQRIGTFHGRSRIGTLIATLPFSADPDNTSTLSVDLAPSRSQLLPGTQADANRFNTLCWVGGELLSYVDAALVAPYRYNLSKLRRGAFNSPVRERAPGTPFLRLDEAVFRYEFPFEYNGREVFFKLLAFNGLGLAKQGLADVLAYRFTLTQNYSGIPVPPNVSGLELFGQGLDATFTGRDAKLAWRPGAVEWSYEFGSEPQGADSGGLDPFFKDYRVTIYGGIQTAAFGSVFEAAPGTLAATNGQKAVVGTGTNFRPGMVGAMIAVLDSGGNTIGGVVDAVQDATHLTLKQNFTGATGGGYGYMMLFELRTEYVVGDPFYAYDSEKNAEDQSAFYGTPLLPVRAFLGKVWQRNKFMKESAVPAQIMVRNPAPVIVDSLATATVDGFVFGYGRPLDTDWSGIDIYVSESVGFTPGPANMVYSGLDNKITVRGLKSNTVYYYRYALKDVFGPAATSAEQTITTEKPVSASASVSGGVAFPNMTGTSSRFPMPFVFLQATLPYAAASINALVLSASGFTTLNSSPVKSKVALTFASFDPIDLGTVTKNFNAGGYVAVSDVASTAQLQVNDVVQLGTQWVKATEITGANNFKAENIYWNTSWGTDFKAGVPNGISQSSGCVIYGRGGYTLVDQASPIVKPGPLVGSGLYTGAVDIKATAILLAEFENTPPASESVTSTEPSLTVTFFI